VFVVGQFKWSGFMFVQIELLVFGDNCISVPKSLGVQFEACTIVVADIEVFRMELL